MRATRWPVFLAAAALLMTVSPVPVAAREGNVARPEEAPQPAPGPLYVYNGWVEIDISRSWDAPNEGAGLLENREDLFIRRFRATLTLFQGSGSNPPSSVSIASETTQFGVIFFQRFKPDPDMPDMCRGHQVIIRGEARSGSYSGAPTGTSTKWKTPGIGLESTEDLRPQIAFLGGNCEASRSPLEQSSKESTRIELGLPGQGSWTFTEGIREPPSSSKPTMIEGSCDSELYNGRIQCQWKVWRGAPQLTPPRRR